MTKITLKIKHGKKTHLVPINTATETIIDLKEKISVLTKVPVESQELLIRGKKMKDSGTWQKYKVKNNMLIGLVGSAQAITRPETAISFVENVSAGEARKLENLLPLGLVNLGNTCYMNSTLQVFRNIPEVVDAINLKSKDFDVSSREKEAMLPLSLHHLFTQILKSEESFIPLVFLNSLHTVYPQFAEKTPQGQLMQHDAEELFSLLLHNLTSFTKDIPITHFPSYKNLGLRNDPKGALWQLFTVETEKTLQCLENPDEPPTSQLESTTKLTCPLSKLDGLEAISFLIEGLQLSMQVTVEKNSPSLGRSAQYEVITRITKAPKYLVIHLNRFSWKTVDGKSLRNKILKQVTFPLELDILPLLSAPLSAYIRKLRQEELKSTTEAMASSSLAKNKSKKTSIFGPKSSETVLDESKSSLKDPIENIDTSRVPPGLLLAPSAKYELNGIITHQGRSADSGHYISFVKISENRWAKFDDDKVSSCVDKDIIKLYGGGDFHIGYMLIYSAIESDTKDEASTSTSTSTSTTSTTSTTPMDTSPDN